MEHQKRPQTRASREELPKNMRAWRVHFESVLLGSHSFVLCHFARNCSHGNLSQILAQRFPLHHYHGRFQKLHSRVQVNN
eukprot:5184000-Amphidinium_carterae.1